MFKDTDGTVWVTEEEQKILDKMISEFEEDVLKRVKEAIHKAMESRLRNRNQKTTVANSLAHIEELLEKILLETQRKQEGSS